MDDNSNWRGRVGLPLGERWSGAAWGPPAARLVLVCLAYYMAARLGLLIPYVNTQISLVWLPTGIALAALWRWGSALLPAVWLAAFAINLHLASPSWLAACTALGNSAGPWLSARVLRQLRFDARMLRRDDLATLVLAVVLGMLVTATNGCAWLLVGGLIDAQQLGLAWLSWWVGDAVGALLAGVPLIALSRDTLALTFLSRRGFGTAVLQALVAGCGLAVFSSLLGPDSPLVFPLLALPVFVIALLALRGGVLASSLAVLLISMAAAWGTARGVGPFAHADDAHGGVLALWSYIAALACTSLLICGLATELHSSRRRFSALMRHAQDGILLIDADGLLLEVNPAAAAMLGLDAQRPPAGAALASLPHGNGAALAALLGQDTPALSCELTLRREHPDGELRVDCQLARYLDASGHWQLHLILRDVTERERAKARLAAGEAWLKAITDHLPALVAYADHTQTYRFANAKFSTVMGVAPEQVVGQTMRQFLGPVAHDALRPHIEAALRGEQQRFERTGWAGNANTHFHVEYVPDVQPDGSVAGFFIMVLDITERRRAELALARSERRLRTITDSVPAMISHFDRELRYTFASARVGQMAGRPSAELLGLTALEVHGDAIDAAALARMQRALAGEPVSYEASREFPDGRRRYFELNYVPEVDDGDGSVRGFYSLTAEVTHRKEIEERLREQTELLQVTLRSIGDGVITTDAEGRIRWMNPLAERMTGWRSAEAAGLPLSEVFAIVDADTRAPAPDPVAACLGRGAPAWSAARRIVLLSRQGGPEHAIEASASPIRPADDHAQLHGAVLVFRDVAEQRRMSDQMAHRATHDDLTGLVNRAGFEVRLERKLAHLRELQEPPPVSPGVLMFIDLDHFKAVNDACGHAQGDRLLCQVAALMGRNVRARDTLARLGGDEFGVLLDHCSIEPARRVAQAICDQIDDYRFVCEQRQFRVGTSIGLVPLDAQWESREALLRAADKACYAAKAAGRNRVHVWHGEDEALAAAAPVDAGWRQRLETALAEPGHFQLFGQRVRPADEGAPDDLHIELLLRLGEPASQTPPLLIAPQAFLPAAERFGLAVAIDRWVLRHALARLGPPGMQGMLPRVSVNVSAAALVDRLLLNELLAMLDTVADASRLCIELGEGAVLAHPSGAANWVAALRERGVRTALDDFSGGALTGAQLKTLPVDWLKIDAQRVRRLPQEPLDRAIVRGFQEIAGAIGAKTIAKGVENEAIAAALRDLRVADGLQGWLLHRPQPVEELGESRVRS